MGGSIVRAQDGSFIGCHDERFDSYVCMSHEEYNNLIIKIFEGSRCE
jgi:hypothetical protein